MHGVENDGRSKGAISTAKAHAYRAEYRFRSDAGVDAGNGGGGCERPRDEVLEITSGVGFCHAVPSPGDVGSGCIVVGSVTGDADGRRPVAQDCNSRGLLQVDGDGSVRGVRGRGIGLVGGGRCVAVAWCGTVGRIISVGTGFVVGINSDGEESLGPLKLLSFGGAVQTRVASHPIGWLAPQVVFFP